MTEYHKLQRLLILIGMLARSRQGMPVQRLARALGTTERTVYRYLELLRDSGFRVEQLSKGRYSIAIGDNDQVLQAAQLIFTPEESALLKAALAAVNASHPLRQALLSKLAVWTDLDGLTRHITHSYQAVVVRHINRAMRQKKQLLLKGYHSANSGQVSDRTVEPYALGLNSMTLHAYEPAQKANRIFRISRIGAAKVQHTRWQHTAEHRAPRPDAFGISDEEPVAVTLDMSLRAANLLREEYPLTEEKIQKTAGGRYRYADTVHGFKGVGRFVLGLAGEIQTLEPEALKQYVRRKLQLLSHIIMA